MRRTATISEARRPRVVGLTAVALSAALACACTTLLGVTDIGAADAGVDAGLPVDSAPDRGVGDSGSDGPGPSDSGSDEAATGDGGVPPCDDACAPPSCQASGALLCGAAGESCCTSLPVATGTFSRTYTNSGSGAVGEADPATVGGVRLDKYLVTVGRFRPFVAAWNGGAGYVPPGGSGKHGYLNQGHGLTSTEGGYESGWAESDDTNLAPTDGNLTCDPAYATWTATPGPGDNLPINCVTWWEAYAFCIWDGGFLPSESEWGYAAAGGSQQREYPWGSTDPGADSAYAIYGCHYHPGDAGCSGLASVAPVGTAAQGAGLFGQLDLAGELYEWNLDVFGPYVSPCTNCAHLPPDASPANRVVRGGSYGDTSLLSAFRTYDAQAERDPSLGFRCARAP
jgi:formylglycine-generating enzyme required for sulfatase activity